MSSDIRQSPARSPTKGGSSPSADPTAMAKKRSGRQRVETEDKTPAERRRTQLRLAQRAYRKRKENTISSLQRKVDELQAIARGMNSSFQRFTEQTMTPDILALFPELASELDYTTRTFANLAARAETVGSEYDGEDSGDANDTSLSPAATSTPPDFSSGEYQNLAFEGWDAQHQGSSHPPPLRDPQGNPAFGYYGFANEFEAAAAGYPVDFCSGPPLSPPYPFATSPDSNQNPPP